MTKEEVSYIAGFLDGDGCVMLQLVSRRDYVLRYQIRASIVFYQKQQHIYFLEWLKRKLTYGYIRVRNDGMAEYTIVGVEAVISILSLLKPYVRLKAKQVTLALSVLHKMPGSGRKMDEKTLLTLAKEVDKFGDLNYSKKRTNTSFVLEKHLKNKSLIP